MPKIRVYFADGSIETFHEEQTFSTITTSFNEDETPKQYSAHQSRNLSLWFHHHDGLSKSFIELLTNSDFFFDVENPDVYYSSKSVVKFENI